MESPPMDPVEVLALCVRTEYLNALSSADGHVSSDLVADIVRICSGRPDLTTTRSFAEAREKARLADPQKGAVG